MAKSRKVEGPRRWPAVLGAVLVLGATAGPLGAGSALAQGAPSPLTAGPSTSSAGPVRSIPAAGSQTASPATSISITGVAPEAVGAIRVSGSASGAVSGTTSALPGNAGVVFDPAADLVPGETVTVSSGVAVEGGTGDGFTFVVGRPASVPAGAIDDDAAAPGRAGDGVSTSATTLPLVSRPDLRPSPVTVNQASTSTESGYLMGGPRATASSDQGLQIYDTSGNLVWFHPVTTPGIVSGNLFADQYLGTPALFWFEGVAPFGPGNNRGEWIAVDSSYRELGRIRMGNGYRADVHELYLTDRGTAYLQAYNPLICTGTAPLNNCVLDAPVLDGVIQEVDVSTGAVLWEWHSLDHVPTSDSFITGTQEVFDYFHMNSIAEDTDGDVIISARNTSADYKIDKATGAIEWTFGGKSPSLTVIGDPDTPKGPDYAHHLRALGGNDYTYFDNGVRRGYSRGAVVHIDPVAETSTYTKIYRHSPEIAEGSQGTMQTLPGGNHVIGWGGAGLVFESTLAGGTYRQYRFDWTGAPAAPPDVVTVGAGASMKVSVSWNGDTRTQQWRIRTGDSPASLSTATTVARNGFETTATVPKAAYVSVQALDGSARVIGQSTTAPAASWFQETAAPVVNGTYTPIVGDFAGSRNDDVIYYAPGSGKDYLHVADGDGGFTSVALPGINGTYTPLVGDFVGDDRDDVLFFRKGSSQAYLWRFDGNARSGALSVRSTSLSVPSVVTQAVVLDNRPAYGGPRDEVLWYAAGSAADRIDHYGWPDTGSLTVTSRKITASGSYAPITGDFDGNGFADIFWYGPGSAPDSTWFLSGSVLRSQTQRMVNTPVTGNYLVQVGNFVGSPDNLELAFVQSGSGADHVWSFDSSGRYRSDTRTSSVGGAPFVLHGATDRLLMWSAGSSPAIWSFDPPSARGTGNTAVGAGYRPLIGDFTGPGGTSSILWYAPGTNPELLYRGE